LKNGIVSETIRPRAAASVPQIPFPTKKVTRAVAERELALLEQTYPQAVTALDYESPFTLLIAVILSAQCTDARVNLTTPALFAAYPTPAALGAAKQEDVEAIVKSCGFFRMKAKNIIAAAKAIAESPTGDVPHEREALEALPGVGRKTANVVLSVAFEEAAFAVDTHVFRVSHRLGLTLGKTPRAVEDDVVKLVPPEKLRHAHHWLILHGRAICKAPTPLCERCPVNAICPSEPIVATTLQKKARAKTRTSLAALKQKRSAKKKSAPKKRSPKAR
jgi:endonuclease-3